MVHMEEKAIKVMEYILAIILLYLQPIFLLKTGMKCIKYINCHKIINICKIHENLKTGFEYNDIIKN